MLVSVVPIGNSKGIRLPKTILDQLEITDQLELQVENRQIILSPVSHQPRAGWDLAFKDMSSRDEDSLLLPKSDPEIFEWEW